MVIMMVTAKDKASVVLNKTKLSNKAHTKDAPRLLRP